MKTLLALGAVALASTSGQALALQDDGVPLILINEIRTDQPGGDVDEYFELLSIPSSASLDGLTYITIGDGAGGSGVVEAVVDLTGSSTGLDGLFLAGEATMTLAVPDLVADINFENSDNVTHLLVSGFTGAAGDDLDTDDDGVLDVLPWTDVLDAVSLIESVGSGDLVYGVALGFNEVGPNGNFVPAHAFRCLTSLSDWRIGAFDPADLSDTAGEFNANCTGVTTIFCDPGIANEFSATGGKMGFTGSFSVQRNATSLTCSDVPNNFGLFAQADMMGAPVMASIGGNICLAGTIQRMNQIVVPVMNVATLPLDIEDMGNVESSVTVGATFYYQFFHRDASTAGGGNYSNGLSATWTL